MDNMKIYFAGSIRGGRDYASLYLKIINELRQYGEVLTEHVGDDGLRNSGEEDKSDKFIHDRDMDWIIESDVIIAEVTSPSLGVGYEIAMAIQLKKRVFCFFNNKSGKRLSAMISGSDNIQVYEYSTFEDVQRSLSEIFI
jgi:nucleoside 2-deoxyribosyltransferase